MADRGFGRVLLLGSLVAVTGGVGQVVYITEKAALEGLVRAFAAELGRKGVLLNLVHPGMVDTENVRAKVKEEVRQVYSHLTLAGRLATAEEIAIASLGLMDPRQGYLTGQTVRITGGADSGGVLHPP